MKRNWVKGNIYGAMDTRSSTSTPEIHSPIGWNVANKHLSKSTPLKAVQQMWGGNQVNDVLGK